MRTLKETITIRRFDDGTCQMDRGDFRFECSEIEVVSDYSYTRIQMQADPIGIPIPIERVPHLDKNYVRHYLEDGKTRTFRGWDLDELTVDELKAGLINGWQIACNCVNGSPLEEKEK